MVVAFDDHGSFRNISIKYRNNFLRESAKLSNCMCLSLSSQILGEGFKT